MSKTLEQECNEVILRQLALEDPEQFGDVESIAADSPVGQIMQWVEATVRNTLHIAQGMDEHEAKQSVAAVLGRTAAMVARAGTALWLSSVYKEAGSDRSPLLHGVSAKQARSEYKEYLTGLKWLAGLMDKMQCEPRCFPVTKDFVREANVVARIFDFLSQRRHELRHQLHASANQAMIGDTIAESSADRGDEIAAIYHTLIVATVLPEEPENWTLRDKPEYLEETLVGLLGDLHHLADAAEMNWRDLLKEANASYEEERHD